MFFKKESCEICKKKYSRRSLVNFAGKYFCCEKCFISYMESITTEQLLNLDKLDRLMNETKL